MYVLRTIGIRYVPSLQSKTPSGISQTNTIITDSLKILNKTTMDKVTSATIQILLPLPLSQPTQVHIPRP